MEFYHAKGLREVTIESVLNKNNRNLNQAFIILKNQANLGYFSANIPLELEDGEVKFLEDIGYKVTKEVCNELYENNTSGVKVNYKVQW